MSRRLGDDHFCEMGFNLLIKQEGVKSKDNEDGIILRDGTKDLSGSS
jgi:hypothetical protein